MREVFGDLFELPGDLLCITTNGMRNSVGRAVMGGGCALTARKLFPGIAKDLGDRLLRDGNHTHLLGTYRYYNSLPERFATVANFPTKEHWANDSLPRLIVQSARELMAIIDHYQFENVLLPRPGCNLGRLVWRDVKPLLDPILDDRVSIVAFPEEA